VVGEAADGIQAVQQALSLFPDLVLMDITMPGMSGLEATKKIKDKAPSIRILVLTMQDNEEYFFPILQAGALGYILKEASPQDLLSAIRAAHKGKAFFSPAVANVILSAYLKSASSREVGDKYASLTESEREVLRLVAQGYTNREVAEELLLSVKTVEKQRARMMEKLGLHNRSDIFKYALRRGLINSQELAS
jgi:two-component system response regulator NreC